MQNNHAPTATTVIHRLDARLQRISQQPFRAKFALRGRDRDFASARGMVAVRRHAHQLIAARLAPAEPKKDGKQTPYRGHPVFVAQHATATCCRKCLRNWHGIPQGRELTDAERDYVVEAICRWISRQYLPGTPPSHPLHARREGVEAADSASIPIRRRSRNGGGLNANSANEGQGEADPQAVPLF